MKDICQLDRESGPCTDPVTQWYFDVRMAQCMQFTYGGCRGNGNRFDSRKLCEQRCLRKNEMKIIIDRTEGKFLKLIEIRYVNLINLMIYLNNSSILLISSKKANIFF